MRKGNISVQTENIFPIIKKYLYSDQDIFLRELISNAVDATMKLKTLSSRGEVEGELGDLTIQVTIDKTNKTLTISDAGIGLTADEMEKYLNQVAFSSAKEFLEKYQNESSIIGHFGLGFYSAFMVAKRVEVVSQSYQKGTSGAMWSCEGDTAYSIEDKERQSRGTDIILHISDDNEAYLEEAKIQELLSTYCRFLPIPIQFGMRTEKTFEGEGEDRTEVETEVPNIINNTNPAWKKQPSELSDEDYKAFYKELHPYSAPPLFWIHLNIDYPFNLTGILYFPKLGNALEVQKNKIQLYSNQVYVTDEVKDIVPEFLTLLHGVIDSPDIPLNVSRSYLQSDRNVKKITGYITKKVAEKLSELYKKDKENYQDKWADLGVFVKYGMMSDDKFYEKGLDFTLVRNTENEFSVLKEYKEKIKTLQTDKYDKVVALYSNAPETQDLYIQNARNKGYDVLIMDNIIDGHFMQQMEYKMNDITFVRVDSDTVENLVQKDEQPESVLSEKDQEKVKNLFESQIEKTTATVQLRPLSPEDQPVQITRPEFMRRMKEMQALQGGADAGFLDHYNVVVNSNHPLIAEKLVRMKSQEKKAHFVTYLYRLAMVNQNMLKGSDLTQFVHQSIEMLREK